MHTYDHTLLSEEVKCLAQNQKAANNRIRLECESSDGKSSAFPALAQWIWLPNKQQLFLPNRNFEDTAVHVITATLTSQDQIYYT